jgi:hypothetical protein
VLQGADVNVMATLPRYNRKATKVSSNWGDYQFVVCPRDVDVPAAAGTVPAAGEPCKLAYLSDMGSLMTQLQAGTTDAKSPVNYFEGLIGECQCSHGAASPAQPNG